MDLEATHTDLRMQQGNQLAVLRHQTVKTSRSLTPLCDLLSCLQRSSQLLRNTAEGSGNCEHSVSRYVLSTSHGLALQRATLVSVNQVYAPIVPEHR